MLYKQISLIWRKYQVLLLLLQKLGTTEMEN